jgi:hypothetical protein
VSGGKPGGEKAGKSTKKWKLAFHKDTEHERPEIMKKDFAPGTDRLFYLDKLKDVVVKQPSNLDWMEVVKKAANEIPGAVPKAQVNSYGMIAFSVNLDHNWRVTCAVADDDATVLVAHVFYSNHKKNPTQRSKYTCVIGVSTGKYTMEHVE